MRSNKQKYEHKNPETLMVSGGLSPKPQPPQRNAGVVDVAWNGRGVCGFVKEEQRGERAIKGRWIGCPVLQKVFTAAAAWTSPLSGGSYSIAPQPQRRGISALKREGSRRRLTGIVKGREFSTPCLLVPFIRKELGDVGLLIETCSLLVCAFICYVNL